MVLQTAVLEKNKQYENMTLGQIAKAQGKGIIDCFLDLAVEENLDTEWLHGENNVDDAAVAQILNYPNAIIGLSATAARMSSSRAASASRPGCCRNGCARRRS